jgi:uncharacterized protein YcaQ
MRRIGAVGMLWNRTSDAFLGSRIKTPERNAAFAVLLGDGLIFEVEVEGLKDPLYIREDDRGLLETVMSRYVESDRADRLPSQESRKIEHSEAVGSHCDQSYLRGEPLAPRCELIAPLDNLMWDRKLIKALFGFDYTWEIYTPVVKRKYGAYVLPLLCGEAFIGRVEAVRERETGTLFVKNVWYEGDATPTAKTRSMVEACLKRFARFNGCGRVSWGA